VDIRSFGGKESTMSSSQKRYSPEFKRQMVELVRAGRTPGELAREFEPSAESIRNWVREAERGEGTRPGGLSSSEAEELKRLRRENKILRQEKEILKKAAAWFARESGSLPPESSSS
jgi:transposase